MAKKSTKMFSDYMKSISPTHELTVSYGFVNGESLDIKVKNYMTVDEKRTFIERVANQCFDEYDEYHPEMRDVVFNITIIQMLTDVPVFSSKVNKLDEFGKSTDEKIEIINIDKTYELCKCLNLYEEANDSDFCFLCDELTRLVAEKIIFKQQRILMGEKKMLERTKSEMEDGIALINSIGDTLNETLKSNLEQTDIIKATNEFTKRMGNMSDEQLIASILGK